MSEQRNHPTRSQSASQRAAKPRRSSSRSKSGVGSTVLKVIGTLFLIGLTTSVFLACFAAVYINTVIIPMSNVDPGSFTIGLNSIIYYTDKETGQAVEYTSLSGEDNRVWVEYDELPKYLIDATVAIEDQRFWTHHGVDWKRTAAAVLYMFTGRDIQGGSTITQQLLKNMTEYDDVTVKRKIVEIFRALEFEKKYDKDDIMEMYLNFIYLGAGCDGVYSASLTYFGKPVQELSLAECASLIAITNNPSLYGPYSEARVENSDGEVWTARQWNKYRQEVILYQMLDQGKITQAEYDQAVAEELHFVKAEDDPYTPSTIYSWYVETVIDDVVADLMSEYQYSYKVAYNMVTSGGLEIYTCLDPNIQKIVDEVYSNRANLNYTSPSGKQQLQSAMTVIDNSTGNVVAVAGRVGEKTGNRVLNLATNAYRQPGSAIKPLSVYSPAFEWGMLSPLSVVDDYPYEVLGGRAYPVNVNHTYRGLTTVRYALNQSLNTIPYRIINDLVTPAGSFEFMETRFHIDLDDADKDRAPLSMGGLTHGVNTRDMAEAFATFPNNGIYTYSRTYTKVVDSSTGKVILDRETPQQEVALKEVTTYYINSILQDVVNFGLATPARISGMEVAGKTGTTSEDYDRYFVGYTPYYTAAVWVGYEYNETINASNPAVNLWALVMKQVHSDLPGKDFSTPAGLTTVHYCMDCGQLASDACALDPRGSRVGTEVVFKDDVPSQTCTCHTQVQVCTDCPILNSDGSETGLYHLAGEFCPEESVKTISLVDYQRDSIGGAVAKDSQYLLSYTQQAGPCTVHTQEVPVEPEEPTDPNNPSNPDGSQGTEGSGTEGGNPTIPDGGGDSQTSDEEGGSENHTQPPEN